MTNNTRSPHELRHMVRICFQPAITGSPELPAGVITDLARTFAETGVTHQRLTNAVALSTPPPTSSAACSPRWGLR